MVINHLQVLGWSSKWEPLEAGTLRGPESPEITSAKGKNGSIRAGPGNRVEGSVNLIALITLYIDL